MYAKSWQHEKAVEVLEQSVRAVRAAGNRPLLAAALQELGTAYFCCSDLEHAEQLLTEALAEWEKMRCAVANEYLLSYSTLLSHSYSMLEQLHLARGNTATALEIAERR
jgi:tetratricopeptide (TPR) repeat protein